MGRELSLPYPIIVAHISVESKVVGNTQAMSENIKNFDISKTFNNVLLTTVSSQDDDDGVPTALAPPFHRTGNLTLRNRGRLQDGFGSEIPLVLSSNVIEVESEPVTAYSVTRRVDLASAYASQFINTLIWS